MNLLKLLAIVTIIANLAACSNLRAYPDGRLTNYSRLDNVPNKHKTAYTFERAAEISKQNGNEHNLKWQQETAKKLRKEALEDAFWGWFEFKL